MKMQARKKKWRVTVITLFLTVIFGFLFFFHFQALKRAETLSEKVDHAYEVVNYTNEVYTILLSAETNERGYIITGDSNFLRLYEESKNKMTTRLGMLEGITSAPPPSQVENIDHIIKLVQRRCIMLNDGIKYRTSNQPRKAVQLLLNTEGKSLMTRLRLVIDELNEAEVKLLHDRSKKISDETTNSFNTLFIGATLILGMILMVYFNRIRLINQLRKTKEELFISNELFHQTLMSLGDGVISTDEQGKVMFMNKVAEKLTGQTLGEVKGKTIENTCRLVDEDNMLYIENPIRKAIARNKAQEFSNHTILISQDKEHYHIEDSVAPIRNYNGGVIGAVMVIRDVTEQSLNRKKLQYAYKNIEEKNQDMVDSIHYAKRIQSAILPRMRDFKQVFPKSFIYYKPKDIVSGDFFWHHRSGNKQYVIAADCTGHGVPGALMSIIGNELLKRIIIEKQISDPSQILYQLEDGISNAVRNSGESNDVKDGMDIAVCVIEDGTRLYFSGASQSLYYSPAGESNIQELKGSLFPIGNNLDYMDKVFDTQSIPVKPGDKIYLSSDGYYSQFGGAERRKYMKKRFKDTLLTLKSKTMQESEKSLVNDFCAWKGELPQVDDVMVIGIEL
jgi:PAS domain S-box-containing protein